MHVLTLVMAWDLSWGKIKQGFVGHVPNKQTWKDMDEHHFLSVLFKTLTSQPPSTDVPPEIIRAVEAVDSPHSSLVNIKGL